MQAQIQDGPIPKIAVQSAVVAGFTALGVVLGYGRDAVVAGWFGTSSITDAYFVAFTIPSTVNQVVITGTLVPAFLPVFVDHIGRDRPAEGWYIASSITNLVVIMMSLLIVVGTVGAPILARILTPGFHDETVALLVALVRLMFPAVLVLGLSGLAGSVLNSLDHFALPALSSASFSLVTILSIFALVPRWGIFGLGIGTVLGLSSQFLIQLPALKRKGMRYSLVCDLRHPGVQKILRLSGPLLLFVALAQVSPLVERVFGSTLATGTIASLTFAMKINILPNMIFASSLAIVLYPALSRHAAKHDFTEFRRTAGEGISFTLFFAVPSAVWLIVAGKPLIRLLFEHGLFTPADTEATYSLLQAYALGIIPASLGGLLIRAFYSLHDSVTPLISGIISTAFYVLTSYLLTRIWQASGLAMSLSLSSGVSTATLLWLLHHKIGPILTKDVGLVVGKMIVASSLMGGLIWMWLRFFGTGVASPLVGQIIQLISLGIVASGSYGYVCYALDVNEVKRVKSLTRMVWRRRG